MSTRHDYQGVVAIMRIQAKLTLLVFLVLVGTISAVVWKTRALLVQDKIGFIADSSMKQIAPLKRLAQERLDEQKARMVKFATGRASLGAGRMKLPTGYESIALVQLQGTEQQFSPSWVEKIDNLHAALPAGFELTLFKSLPYSKVRDGETFWVRLSDRQGNPVYALMISVEIQAPGAAAPSAAEASGALPDSVDYASSPSGAGRKAILVGLSANDPLADLTEDYIGSTNTVYIIDDKGYVASHVNKANLGALFAEDPMVAEIINTKKTAASGNYEDLENRAVLGHFERIDRTNLYAVITTPLKATQDSVSAHVRTVLLAATAVGLLGLLLIWVLSRHLIQAVGENSSQIAPTTVPVTLPTFASGKTAQLGAVMASTDASTALAQSDSQSDSSGARASASKSVDETFAQPSTSSASIGNAAELEILNAGFVNSVKEPLLAILGHAQLAKSKLEDKGEIAEHAASIEREARRAKDIVDRLRSWSENKTPNVIPEAIDLQQMLTSILGEYEEKLKAEGVFVAKELHSVPKVRGSAEAMRVAIRNLFDNACEAMRARPKKHLRVQLDFRDDNVRLEVVDTGVGMTRDVKERAFEPFFKSFESPERVGLGLALVAKAVKQMGGKCEVASTMGEGATFTLSIPVAADDKYLFNTAPISSSPALEDSAPAMIPPAGASVTTMEPLSSVIGVTLPEDLEDLEDLDDVEGLEKIPTDDRVAFAMTNNHDSDDDDDDEQFSQMSLSKIEKPAEVSPSPDDPDGFKVRIRRPRIRS
jgi:signal transduction histidine kinase